MLTMLGAQGTTGTQASFLEIFGGDGSKCDRLNELLCQKTGFPGCYDVSTQTYTRKVDLIIANAVCGLGATAQKITGDIRHLASWKEVEESVLVCFFPIWAYNSSSQVLPCPYPRGFHVVG
jgi:adenylosuccinate lyase